MNTFTKTLIYIVILFYFTVISAGIYIGHKKIVLNVNHIKTLQDSVILLQKLQLKTYSKTEIPTYSLGQVSYTKKAGE